MTDSDPAFQDGRRAAAQGIPEDANPHRDGTPDARAWADGHRSVATAVEASQSEG